MRALSEIQKTLEPAAVTAETESEEVERLQAQLAEMEAESRKLTAILELEQMKSMLLGLNVSSDPSSQPPRSAWGEAPDSQQQQPEAAAPAQQQQQSSSGGGEETLTAADEARLARLMAEEEEFDAMPPSEMAATLARMEAELGQLKMRSETHGQQAQLDRMKRELAEEQSSLQREHAALSGLWPGVVLK